MSYKRQEVFTLRKNKGSAPVFGRVSVPYLFSFQCCVVFCFSSFCDLYAQCY